MDLFAGAGADIIYVHLEADRHIAKTLAHIRALGKRAGLALNPGSSLELASEALALTDCLLLMTVNPGFAGQDYLPFVDRKIRRAAELKKKYGFMLAVDGAIAPEKVAALSQLGVDAFVLGTSALFGKGEFAGNLTALRH